MNWIPLPRPAPPEGSPEAVLSRIVAVSAATTGASVSDVMGRPRFYPIGLARMIAAHIAVRDFRFRYGILADFFNRSRSTVQYSAREIGLRAACDRKVAWALNRTRRELGL